MLGWLGCILHGSSQRMVRSLSAHVGARRTDCNLRSLDMQVMYLHCAAKVDGVVEADQRSFDSSNLAILVPDLTFKQNLMSVTLSYPLSSDEANGGD